jgi:hypothetical protein
MYKAGEVSLSEITYILQNYGGRLRQFQTENNFIVLSSNVAVNLQTRDIFLRNRTNVAGNVYFITVDGNSKEYFCSCDCQGPCFDYAFYLSFVYNNIKSQGTEINPTHFLKVLQKFFKKKSRGKIYGPRFLLLNNGVVRYHGEK